MAKSDSFFIRASVPLTLATAFQTTSIDLGAYVDALGKSVLRIHNIVASFQASNGKQPTMADNAAGACGWQLTTQDQSSMVLPSDRAVISSGSIWARNPDGAINAPTQVFEADMLPQEWTNGYLVAVESLQLGGFRTDEWTASEFPVVSIVMECTVETLSAAGAMALALSQQGN